MKYNDPSGHKACSGFDEYVSCISDADWKPSNWEPNNSGSSGTPLNPLNNLPNIEDTPLQVPTSPGDNNGPFIGSSCTVSTPCLEAWEQPDWWNTDPKNPDYMSYSVSLGEGLGGTLIIVVDRYGQVFVSVGVNIGKSITPISGSVMRGSVGDPFDNGIPTPMESEEFHTGVGANASIGALGGVGLSLNPSEGYYPNHFGYENGVILIAQLGVSIGISWKVH